MTAAGCARVWNAVLRARRAPSSFRMHAPSRKTESGQRISSHPGPRWNPRQTTSRGDTTRSHGCCETSQQEFPRVDPMRSRRIGSTRCSSDACTRGRDPRSEDDGFGWGMGNLPAVHIFDVTVMPPVPRLDVTLDFAGPHWVTFTIDGAFTYVAGPQARRFEYRRPLTSGRGAQSRVPTRALRNCVNRCRPGGVVPRKRDSRQRGLELKVQTCSDIEIA